MQKRKYLLLYLLPLAMTAGAQNPTPLPAAYSSSWKPGFVRTWDASAPETNSATFQNGTLRQVKQTTAYYDGAGRPIQSISKEGSLITGSSPVDMISASVYDAAGREQLKYLPFASTATDATKNNGLFKLNPLQQQAVFYNNQLAGQSGEANVGPNNLNWAYTFAKFEESPLNRPAEVFSPGSSWVGTSHQASESNRHSIKMKYWTNTSTDAVRSWTVTVASSTGSFSTYASSSTYTIGTLYKSVAIDEKGRQVIEFKDKAGRVILKKVQMTAAADNGSGSGHSGWLCTYFIYDKLGNLRCTVTPRGVELISSNWILSDATILAEQCYRYEYDARHRKILQKNPGAGEEYLVYDNKGRAVMTQDANMRASSPAKWLVSLYDKYDRPVQTGLWNNVNDLAYHTAQANSASSDYPFSETTIPGSGYERLTRAGYDRYSSLPSGTGLTASFDNTYTSNSDYFYTTYNVSPDYAQPLAATNQTRGLATWTETKVLNSSPAVYLYSVHFYDNNGRLIQAKKNNVEGGVDVITTQYGWGGQALRVLEKVEVPGSPAQVSLVLTMLQYDDLGRLKQTDKKTRHTLINANQLPASWSTIAKNEYNALGQLKTKKVGGKKNISGAYTGSPMETLEYDYNVRGWMLGMNRSYLTTQGQSGTARFGFELGYDKLTNSTGQNFIHTPQLSGSITGMVWKSDGSDIRRKYDYKYDEAYRLLKADFVQQNADNSLWNNSQINYTVQWGDGSTGTTAYDVNGNIKSLTRNGYKPGAGSSSHIDQLTYNYMFNNTSNRLLNVIDAANLPDTRLGDFRTSLLHTQSKTSTTVDYTYDDNGNLVKDLNKDLVSHSGANGLGYNHLDLVQTATVKKDGSSNKGAVYYTYSAAGSKLKKQVEELNVTVSHNGSSYSSNITTITYYISSAVYESRSYSNSTLNTALGYSNRLQFLSHEEGRTRLKVLGNDLSLHYDYFIRDHIGNVRMVLTEETGPASIYEATMELAVRNDEVQLFAQIPETESAKPTGFDNESGNQKVSKLFNGSGNDKRVGPGIVLKVMAGDKFKAHVLGWYQPGSTNVNTLPGAPGILSSLLSALTGAMPAGSKYSGAELGGSGVLNAPVGDFLTYQDGQLNAARPRAWLNWMILDDEQFKLVSGSYGAVQVPEITGSMQKQVMQAAGGSEIEVTRNGYLFVYVSNESQGNVYFDNLRVEHTRGALTEETHYYPEGMQMAGIGSRALLAGYVNNKFTYQGQEQETTFDLYWLEFEARIYDAQLGRWHVQDPANQLFASPYSGMNNSWPSYVDPDGRIFWLAVAVGALVGGYTGYKIGEARGATGWSMFGYIFGGAAIGGLSGALGATITSSGGFMANTAGIMFSSYSNSMGMAALSGGMMDPGVSFGAASLNFGTGEWGYLGKKGNSTLTNIGYAFGAMANLQDLVTGIWGHNYEYQYETNAKEPDGSKIGHANIRNAETNTVEISVANANTIVTKKGGILGAAEWLWKSNFKKYSGGGEYWGNVPEVGWPRLPLRLNSKIIDWMSDNIKKGKDLWGLGKLKFGVNFGCVSYTARALWTVGVPTLPIVTWFGPRILWLQLAIRQAGIYSSPYLYNLPE